MFEQKKLINDLLNELCKRDTARILYEAALPIVMSYSNAIAENRQVPSDRGHKIHTSLRYALNLLSSSSPTSDNQASVNSSLQGAHDTINTNDILGAKLKKTDIDSAYAESWRAYICNLIVTGLILLICAIVGLAIFLSIFTLLTPLSPIAVNIFLATLFFIRTVEKSIYGSNNTPIFDFLSGANILIRCFSWLSDCFEPVSLWARRAHQHYTEISQDKAFYDAVVQGFSVAGPSEESPPYAQWGNQVGLT